MTTINTLNEAVKVRHDLQNFYIRIICTEQEPKNQLPHCIFFEDVDENGEPEFRKARLIHINRENQSCHIEYKDGSQDEIFLSAIESDWLHVLAECLLGCPN